MQVLSGRILRPALIGLVLGNLLLAGGPGGSAHSGTASSQAHLQAIHGLVTHLSLRQKIGQLLMVSFGGTSMNPTLSRMLKQIQPGGVVLFSNNFASPRQLRHLDAQLQSHSHLPLLVAVDQEGGEVDRITAGVKHLPSEAAYGRQGNASRLYRDVSAEAVGLRRLGINMNLAPVLDVATPNSIIGQYERSFGNNAQRDAALGWWEIRGYQRHDVAAVGKHVVGLGTTQTDPEISLPRLSLSRAELNRQLVPFRRAIRAGVDAIMVTHVIIKGVTAPRTPASLSYRVVTDLLRKQLKFGGVLMTDSLSMGAITTLYSIPRASVMGINAGEDILLITPGGTQTGIYTAAVSQVVAKLKAHRVSMIRVNQSVARILALKQKLHLRLPKT